jgi:hypothetical protein
MNLEQGRDDRAESLGRQPRALAAGRHRYPNLDGRRLVRQDVNGAIADQLAARPIKRGNLHPRPRRSERHVSLRSQQRLRVAQGIRRLPRLVPRDLRVRSVRNERR